MISADVIIGKPSKALNLVFLIFGYVLASYIVSEIELVFEQQVPALIIAGGVFSSFLYYLKPIDRFIVFLLHLARKPESAYNFSKNLLADERVRINGAVFFSVSLLLAARLLHAINLYIRFEILLFFSGVMMLVAVYETLVVIFRRVPLVTSYYYLQRYGTIAKEFKEAVEAKNWDLAESVKREQERPFEEDQIPTEPNPWAQGGFCPQCGLVTRRENALFCSECGDLLVTHCLNCKKEGKTRYVLTKETDKPPNFCNFCGKPLFRRDKEIGKQVCPQCGSKPLGGPFIYCTECGTKLISLDVEVKCDSCGLVVKTKEMDKLPKYCWYCGKSVEKLWKKDPPKTVKRK